MKIVTANNKTTLKITAAEVETAAQPTQPVQNATDRIRQSLERAKQQEEKAKRAKLNNKMYNEWQANKKTENEIELAKDQATSNANVDRAKSVT